MFSNNNSQLVGFICLKARISFYHATASVAAPMVVHTLGTVAFSWKNLTLKLLFALWMIRREKSCAIYLEKLYFFILKFI